MIFSITGHGALPDQPVRHAVLGGDGVVADQGGHAGQRGGGRHHQLRRQRPGVHDALGCPRQQARPQVRPPPQTPARHIRKFGIVFKITTT